MQEIVSTTVSLEQTQALPHNQYSGNFLGARQASHRHFPHSRQIIESDCSTRIAEFEGNVEVCRGEPKVKWGNVLIKLIFDCPCSCCSDIEDDIEDPWLGHKR